MSTDTIPEGADQLPGVTELYEEFHAARAARNADKTRETLDRFNAAASALGEARSYWRQIRDASVGTVGDPQIPAVDIDVLTSDDVATIDPEEQ